MNFGQQSPTPICAYRVTSRCSLVKMFYLYNIEIVNIKHIVMINYYSNNTYLKIIVNFNIRYYK